MFGTHCDTAGCRNRPAFRVVLVEAHPRRRGETITTDKERCAECFLERVAPRYGAVEVLTINTYPIERREA